MNKLTPNDHKEFIKHNGGSKLFYRLVEERRRITWAYGSAKPTDPYRYNRLCWILQFRYGV